MGAGVILSDFFRALAQLGDGRFLRVVLWGIALAAALLYGAYRLFLWVILVLVPDTVTLPLIGPVGGLDTLAGWGSVFVMLVLSVFLMVPVAAAFSGLFLEQVADAVEDRHYPQAAPVKGLSLLAGLIEGLQAFAILFVANLLALMVFAFAGPVAPLLFWALNGALLGREYFRLVAMRRLGRQGAAAFLGRHRGQVWLAGMLMAAPLSIPLLGLIVPVLGVASFTHTVHRLARADGLTL